MRVDEASASDSSANKLRIYEFRSISNYDSCLFLDSDILITSDINPCLSVIGSSDVFLVSTEQGFFSRENSIVGGSHAGPLLSDPEIQQHKHTKSICAGCFAFPVRTWSLEFLQQVLTHYTAGKRLPFFEQHHFNYGLLQSGRYSYGLQPFITHQGHLDLPEIPIVHYPGHIGKSAAKLDFMSRDFAILGRRRSLYLESQMPAEQGALEISYQRAENSVWIVFLADLEAPRIVIFDVTVPDEPFLIYQTTLQRIQAGQRFWFSPGVSLTNRVFRVDVHDRMDLRVKSSIFHGEAIELVSCHYDTSDETVKCQANWQCRGVVSIGPAGEEAIYTIETHFQPGVVYWYTTSPGLPELGEFWISVTEPTTGTKIHEQRLSAPKLIKGTRRFSEHTFYPDLLSDSPVILDLGACVGEFTSLFLSAYPGSTSLMVEPLRRNFDTIQTEGTRSRKVLGAVVGTPQSVVEFMEDVNTIDCGSIEVNYFGGIPHKVPGFTLKELFEPFEKIDLVKMDIEGAEWDCLMQTDEETILKSNQYTIEFHDFLGPEYKQRTLDCITKMESCGYKWEAIGTDWKHGSPFYDVVFYLDSNKPDTL